MEPSEEFFFPDAFGEKHDTQDSAIRQLRELRKLLKENSEWLKIGTFEVSYKGDYLYWSPEVFRILRRSPASGPLNARDWLKICHPEDRNKLLTTALKGGASLRTFQLTHRVMCGDGRIRSVLVTVSPYRSVRMMARGLILDVSKVAELERELEETNRLYRSVYDSTKVGLLRFQLSDGRILSGNPAFSRIFGYENPSELLSDRPTISSLASDGRIAHNLLKEINMRGEVHNLTISATRKDGGLIYVSVSAHSDPDTGQADGSVMDITLRKKATNTLYREKEILRTTLTSLNEAVIRTNSQGEIEYMNPSAEKLIRQTFKQISGKSLFESLQVTDTVSNRRLVSIAEELRGRDVLKRKNLVLTSGRKSQTDIELSLATHCDERNNLLGFIAVIHDVSEQKRLQELLNYQANHDFLTGLPNRAYFQASVENAVLSAHSENRQHALCFIDLDQFKIVNDTCGHYAGDELLRTLAQVLKARVKGRDLLGRLGGDEFGLLLCDVNLRNVERAANRLRKVVEEFKFPWGGKLFRVGASIGVVMIDQSTENMAQAMRDADSACYTAKDLGRNQVCIFNRSDDQIRERRQDLAWPVHINEALDEDRFEIYAQEIRSTRPDGEALQFELLLRMRGRNDELILPGRFLPAAERYRLMTRLDLWMLRNAFKFISSHPEVISKINYLSINLSGSSLGDRDFEKNLNSLLQEFDIPCEKVVFEITETSAISNLNMAIGLIKSLREYGFRFALDDFGSGLSSIAYLKMLPVDYLKIDGIFVRDMDTDITDYTLVKSIHELGKTMGKQTITEYVERPEVHDKIRELNIDYVQGYGISEPRPLSSLIELINQRAE